MTAIQPWGVFMTVDIIGGGKREAVCADIIKKKGKSIGFSKIVIFPIPSSRDKRTVTGTDIELSGLISEDMRGTLYIGFDFPIAFVSSLKERGGAVADVVSSEYFTNENARLTAECTLLHIMKEGEVSVKGMKIAIVGYGRIGKRLLEILLFFGASPKVLTRSESTRMELIFSGVDAGLVADAELSDFDLIVNTAPSSLFSARQSDTARCEVLELAPGENLPYMKKVTRLPSLPAKALPVSGGRIYAESALEVLMEEGEF